MNRVSAEEWKRNNRRTDLRYGGAFLATVAGQLLVVFALPERASWTLALLFSVVLVVAVHRLAARHSILVLGSWGLVGLSAMEAIPAWLDPASPDAIRLDLVLVILLYPLLVIVMAAYLIEATIRGW